jgi:putative membrane protein
MAEVNAGQMAAQKGMASGVKAFGNRMVQDHGKANEELKQLATLKGLALPTEPAEQQKHAAEHMASLSGAEFDKAYMTHMVEDHEKDVAAFDKASRESQDADIKTWAAKTLPTLQDHLEVAKETQRKLR